MQEKQRPMVAAFSVSSSISTTKKKKKNTQSLRSFPPTPADLYNRQRGHHDHPLPVAIPSRFLTGKSGYFGTPSQLSLSPSSSFSSLLTATDELIISTTSGGSSTTSFEPIVDGIITSTTSGGSSTTSFEPIVDDIITITTSGGSSTTSFEPFIDDIITSTTSGGSSATSFEPTTFEPIVDVPALLSSMLVLVGALLLRLRQNAIAQAAEDRIIALEKLRDAKKKELSLEISSEEAQIAVLRYEKALEKEEQVRTLIPGVRLKAPNNPQRSKENQEAVRQFLDAESDATLYVTEVNTDNTPQTKKGTDDVSSDGNYVGPALGLGALLLLIFSPQFLSIFLNESDTKEILDILGSS